VKKITLLFVLTALAVSFSFAQSTLKIGYVNSETVIKDMPEAKDSQQQLEAMVKTWQEEIAKRSQALKDKYEEYQKQSNMLTETAKQAKQKELVDEEQQLNQYQSEKQQELSVQREKIMKPIQDKVYKAIAKMAKEKNLSFVFDKATDVPVLYADPKFDYTPDVLIILKRGGK
jgi:outer membrane protein